MTSKEALLQFPEDLWKMAADRLIPALEHGLPKLGNELSIIRQALTAGLLNPERCLQVLARGPAAKPRRRQRISELGSPSPLS